MYMYMYTRIRMHMYIYTFMFAYMYTYTYMYICRDSMLHITTGKDHPDSQLTLSRPSFGAAAEVAAIELQASCVILKLLGVWAAELLSKEALVGG